MVASLLLLVLSAQVDRCRCQCIDGVPKLTCRSVQEALAAPPLCSSSQACPIALEGDGLVPPGHVLLDDAVQPTVDCFEVRVATAAPEEFRSVRVCAS